MIINYNFSTLEKIFKNINQSGKPTSNELNILRREINNFYDDVECTQIIFTNNTDKQLFGMCVYPIIKKNEVINVVNNQYKLDKYILEIDSKLFNSIIQFTEREIVAIILHEIGHIMNDTKNMEKVSNYMNAYQGSTNTSLSLNSIFTYSELFIFVLKRTLRQLGSIFEKDQSE